MDPAQGESGGGRSLISKPKANPKPHRGVKDKMKNLKNRLPGMKKHGDEDGHEDNSSEYDEHSPRSPGPETGYNVAESTPFTTVNETPDSYSPASHEKISPPVVHNPDYDSRPAQISPGGYDSQISNPRGYNSQISPGEYDAQTNPRGYDAQNPNYVPAQIKSQGYDAQNPNYVPSQINTRGYDAQYPNYISAAAPTRQAPQATELPRSNLAPSMEEKFQYLDVGEKPPRDETPQIDRGYQPEQQSYTTPPIDRGYQPEQQAYTTPPIDRGYQPEQPQSYSPSTTESVRKGYSDAPTNTYRASSTAPANKGMLDKVKETVAGATAVLGDRVGYYNDHTPTPRDPNAPSLLDKAKATLGVDKPRDPNAPPLTEKAKAYVNVASQKTREYSATAADRAAWTRDRVAAQTTPTQHDKALSEQVTQSLSNLPGAIKAKVFSPATPNTANSPAGPGLVDRVSSAVSSLFTTATPRDRGEHLQHTFPAHSDHDHVHPAPGPYATPPPPYSDHVHPAPGPYAAPTPPYSDHVHPAPGPYAAPTPPYADYSSGQERTMPATSSTPAAAAPMVNY